MPIKKLIFAIGTRPEAIKMAPLILMAKKELNLGIEIVNTSQHPELCEEALESFGLKATIKLNAFKKEQNLSELSFRIAQELGKLNLIWDQTLTFIQGDTTSALMVAYVGFLNKGKIIHIEAGLRTHSDQPFPEELNRKLISQIADFNFCVTNIGAQNLLREGISQEKIAIVGNTIIDSMNFFGASRQNILDKKEIIITLHRRENQGEIIQKATEILGKIANEFNENFNWIFINHPNPNNSKYFDEKFRNNENIQFIDPLKYPEMLKRLSRCFLLITDSGGFQEEATYLGLPTLVLRKYTERPEAITVGSCILIRNIENELEAIIHQLFENESEFYNSKAKPNTVFGIGDSSIKIVKKIEQTFL